MSNGLVLWESPNGIEIPKSAGVAEVMPFNVQLTPREVKQVAFTYGQQFYDMSSEYIWLRAINLLREKVLSLGADFVFEMLGRTDHSDTEKLPEVDIINLASELGFINKIGKVKLLQANELIQYYSSRDSEEEMDRISADLVIITCIKYILGQDNSNLKLEYNNFRENLKLHIVVENSEIYSMISNSPYFYKRTTVRTLLNLLKQTKGAELENIYANIQIIIPAIWDSLLSDDRYPIGFAYAQAVNDSSSKIINVLKTLLLKVKGFDYVPENLRSTTFINAAKNLISVHYAANNYYNEPAAIKNLASLGTTIPTPALGVSITAALIVKIGNTYGLCWEAQSYADEILATMYEDKWRYYFDKVFIGDELLLIKLLSGSLGMNTRWCELVNKYELYNIEINNKYVKRLLEASSCKDFSKIGNIATDLYANLSK